MFECFDGTLLGIWFDGLMFDIGITSLLPYFYPVQGTERSAADQISVTCILCGHRGVDVKYSTKKNALPYGYPSARKGS
jgi:hypothetical protein